MTQSNAISLLTFFLTHPDQRDDVMAFIEQHKDNDVKDIALKSFPDESWPRIGIMNQIKSYQKAKDKIPSWCAQNHIVFPAPDILEQASSSATSAYKASLISGTSFADLTAGSGADSAAFADKFKTGTAIDIDAENCTLLAHNLPQLTNTAIEIINSSAEEYLNDMPPVDFIYLDPQRRVEGGKRGLILLETCTPSVPEMLPSLLEKTKTIMVKTSPALDIARCVHDLKNVTDIHILEWRGQCREVIYMLKPGSSLALSQIPIHAVSLDDQGHVLHKLSFTIGDEKQSEDQVDYSCLGTYLYEASPAMMKSGGFHYLAKSYGLTKLHKHTHLYISDNLIDEFPGRRFLIEHIVPADKKALKAVLPDKKANLSIRNFPMTVEQLKKKLDVKDGGKTYIFACITAPDENHRLILCSKA